MAAMSFEGSPDEKVWFSNPRCMGQLHAGKRSDEQIVSFAPTLCPLQTFVNSDFGIRVELEAIVINALF